MCGTLLLAQAHPKMPCIYTGYIVQTQPNWDSKNYLTHMEDTSLALDNLVAVVWLYILRPVPNTCGFVWRHVQDINYKLRDIHWEFELFMIYESSYTPNPQ